MKVPAEITSGLLEDIFNAVSFASGVPIPGGATAAGIFSSYMRRKAHEATIELNEQIRLGNIDLQVAASQDDLIGVLYIYSRAVIEGSARRNVRLLAKAVVGLATRGTLYADEFKRYADILAALSRDEIILLGTMYRCWLDAKKSNDQTEPFNSAKQKLYPDIFDSEERILAIAAQAQRTGLIRWSNRMDVEYMLSPLMFEVADVVDFNEALRQEGFDR